MSDQVDNGYMTLSLISQQNEKSRHELLLPPLRLPASQVHYSLFIFLILHLFFFHLFTHN